MTTVGAAWAINPTAEDSYRSSAAEREPIQSIVYEGEPQVLAQLMGATVGLEHTPSAVLGALTGKALPERRVVVAKTAVAEDSSVSEAQINRIVEELESAYASTGKYPTRPESERRLEQVKYRTTGSKFEVEGYDSDTGKADPESVQDQDQGPADFALAGQLESKVEGWGPWESNVQVYSPQGRWSGADLSWLASLPPAPSWSARMFFPIDIAETGYMFRNPSGKSAYESGELLYDAVGGTFQMKLFRKEARTGRAYSAVELEDEMSDSAPGGELVGDAQLLADLGFLVDSDPSEPVVHVASPTRLAMSADSALDGLTLSAFSKHKRVLSSGAFAAGEEDSESTASLVGRLEVVDKVGQVHKLRVRAGSAGDYDWVVGQLCPLEDVASEVEVIESVAYDNVRQRKVESTVIAGK